jgi:mRNA turnover protein 4
MPKSKRTKVVHMTQVAKKGREHKERIFENIRECVPQYQHIFVFGVDNSRNTHLQEIRKELKDDSR